MPTAAGKITTEAFEKALRQEMETAVGKSAETLSAARAANEAAYLASPLGQDEERKKGGYSTIIDRTVMETVEWAKPGLLRVFTSSDEIVRIEPRRPEHEQAAEDATDYLNRVVFGQGVFSQVHNVISDALLQRAGWWKVCYEDDPPKVPAAYSGLSEREAYALLVRHGADAASVARSSDGPEPVYSVTVETDDPTSAPGGVKIVCLPPERVLYNQDALDIATARFVAHWEEKTVGELRRRGFDPDILDGVAEDDDAYPETQIRNRINDDAADADSGRDSDMKSVRLYEAYILMPGGDGHAGPTRHKVEYVGGDGNSVKVLRSEVWTMPRPPLFPLSSVPVPHKPVGLGLADLVMDLQRLRTELSRQMLDGLASANQGELFVVRRNKTDELDYDQLLNRRVGGVYEGVGDISITPFPVDSAVVAQAAAALQMTDKAKETRTGVGQQMEGLSADALQGTATGASIYQEAANERLELVARVIAEMLFKPVAAYVLLLVSRYQKKPLQLRLKGRFFQWNPSAWDPAMDVRVSVGLGTGNRARQSAGLQQIIALQAQIMEKLGANSPVRLTHFLTACHRMAQSLGFESPEQFFGTVEDARKSEEAMLRQQPEPSPEQRKLELEKQKSAAELQIKQQASAADILLEQQKAQAQILLQQAKMAADARNTAMKTAADAELGAQQIEAEKQLDMVRAAMRQTGPGTGVIRGAQL